MLFLTLLMISLSVSTALDLRAFYAAPKTSVPAVLVVLVVLVASFFTFLAVGFVGPA